MAIKYNNVNTLWQGATWLKLGWQLFKQQPITWAVMTLIFVITSVIGTSFVIGKFIVALIAPIFAGGIFITMDKSVRGEKAQIEGLFAAFKHKPTLKQLLLIGLVGVAVTGLNVLIEYLPGSDYMMSAGSGNGVSRDYRPISLGAVLSELITVPWMLAVVFAVPLVAIKQHQAIPALKNSLWVSLMHLISILPFLLMVALLTIVAVLPVGLGLLVLLPVLFGSVYSAFSMIYTGPAQRVDAENLSEPASPAEPTSTARPIENAIDSEPSVPAALSAVAPLTAQEHIKRAVDKQSEDIQLRVQRPAVDISLPKQLEIKYFDDYICITRRWFRARAIVPVVLAFVSIGANYVIFSGKMDSMTVTGEQWFIDLLPWLLALFALVSGYLGITRCLNHTDIYASAETIEIRHRPLPWFGNKRLQASNIKQLYVEEETRVVDERSGRTRRYYHLEVMPHTGASYSLLRSLDSNQQALYIEQEIEKFLNIQDQPI